MNRTHRSALRCVLLGVVVVLWASCSDSQEALRVELPVVADGNGLHEVTTDQGYTIEITAMRVALTGLEFTTSGEAHLAWWSPSRWLMGVAYAHPGHYAGGEIIGELPGRYVVDLVEGSGVELGVATLLEGDYNGANFTFAQAGMDDGLEPSDPLMGHSVWLEGVARRDGQTVAFTATIDQDDDRQVVGAPLELELSQGMEVMLGFQLLPQDPATGATLFDGIDFASLDSDSLGHITLEGEAPDANRLRRALQTHDFYNIAVLP
ncbi:MAG: hypothetical protein AAFS10_09985 [Myxococcota bacterium]